MPTSNGGYAFIVLLRDGDDANGLARLLDDVRLPHSETPAVFTSPPVRGVDFFADESSQVSIDKWWADNVPSNALPVYLLMHEDGLVEWIKGLDGTFYIGVAKTELLSDYEGSATIKPFLAGGPLDFATAIMRDFSSPEGTASEGSELSRSVFDHGEALRMAALSSDFPIDLDDSAFDFGDPSDGGAAPYPPTPSPFGVPTASPSPFGAPATSPFPPAATPSPYAAPPGFGAPASPFGAPAGFGAPAPTPAPKRAAPTGPPPPHPFDFISGTAAADVPTTAPAAPESPAPPAPTAVPETPAPPVTTPDPSQPVPMGGPDWMPPAPATSTPQNGGSTRPQAGYSAQNVSPSRTATSKSSGPLAQLGALFKGKGATRSGFTETPNREIASIMVERGPTLVVMGSRKGGVGKTSYAAGIAIIAGQILDTVGHKAAIVDANIANPDAWGQMNLREGAATVREVVAALTANREPPPPVHSTTPALACYPESRETTEYSKTDIKRFSDYLKRRYTFIVVDMSNRLPDPMAGPESAAAAYWLEHADVLVLPTTSAKTDFNGVLDYLDVRDLPPTIVPYIVPKIRRNRDHPVTQQYLAVIRERVHRIVDVPDEADKVRFAGMEGIPVEQVSASLRAAYRELTETIVRVPPRARV